MASLGHLNVDGKLQFDFIERKFSTGIHLMVNLHIHSMIFFWGCGIKTWEYFSWKMTKLPKTIILRMCLSVCENYVVHYLITNLCCAPWCTRETYVLEKWGSAQCTVLIRWCTRHEDCFACSWSALTVMVQNMMLSVYVCVCEFVRATLCTTSTVQDYVVHHQPALCPIMHKAPWMNLTHMYTPDEHRFPLVHHGAKHRWCTT